MNMALPKLCEPNRGMETHFNWVECFDPAQQHCRLLPTKCRLKHLLALTGNAYLQVLDTATLADVLSGTFNVELLPHKEPLDDILK